jgi:hypothetical protein
MRKILILVLSLFTLAFLACSSDSDQKPRPNLRELVIEAITGDSNANVQLQGLIDSIHIGKTDFNQLHIDSLFANRKYYYSVLLEYFDPTLNLFAIYDDNLKFYLLDRSLNGYLSSEWVDLENRNFVFVQENFLTKDVLNIDRFSVYEIIDTTASLVYRSISRFVNDKDTSTQIIKKIAPDFILTKITLKTHSKVINQVDTFYFKSDIRKYLSTKDVFNNFVKKEINDFERNVSKPQIPAIELKDNPPD